MGTGTRFDSLIEKEIEKKKSSENPFAKSQRTLKGSDRPKAEKTEAENIQETEVPEILPERPVIRQEPEENSKSEVSKQEAGEKKKEENSTPAAAEKSESPKSSQLDIQDILAATQRVKKDESKSRSFYMKNSVYEKLERLAAERQITVSQLHEIILESVLGKM